MTNFINNRIFFRKYSAHFYFEPAFNQEREENTCFPGELSNQDINRINEKNGKTKTRFFDYLKNSKGQKKTLCFFSSDPFGLIQNLCELFLAFPHHVFYCFIFYPVKNNIPGDLVYKPLDLSIENSILKLNGIKTDFKFFLFREDYLKQTGKYESILKLMNNYMIPLNTDYIFIDETSFPKFYLDVLQIMIKKINFQFKTTALNSKYWMRNYWINLFLYGAHKTIIKKGDIFRKHSLALLKTELSGKTNKPVFLIGASPKLDKDITALKIQLKEFSDKNNGKPLIFAMDNSVWTLCNHNIKPDFILCLDPRPVTTFFIPDAYKTIPLILPITGTYHLANFSQILYYYNIGLHFSYPEKFNCRDFANSLPDFNLPATNIGTVSLFILKYLNLNKPLLFGIDYSFDEMKYYSSSTFFMQYLRIHSNFISTALDNSTKRACKSSDQKLYAGYKKEFMSFLNNWENLKVDFDEQSKIQTSDEKNIPLISYYYLKYFSIEKAQKSAEQFMTKYLNLDPMLWDNI